MLRASLRSLLAHKLRLALTAVAVVLGVAFVSGSLVFTDTLNKTFTELFTQVSPDVVVEPDQALARPDGPPDASLTLPASVLHTVNGVPGVARALGSVFSAGVTVIGKDGKVVGAASAPAFGSTYSDDPDLSPYRPVEGRAPANASELALDSQTMKKGAFSLGDQVHLVTPVGKRSATVVGVFQYGTTGNLAGASIAAFDLRTSQEILVGGKDVYTGISIKAVAGVSQQQLADRVTKSLAGSTVKLTVQTGKAAADKQAASITDSLKFISVFLLVFAGIALVVGSFLIVNTFSMLVAQRTRELALLRAIGASRRQVTSSVLTEALVVGLVGSTVGLGTGLLLAMGLKALFGAAGVDLPAGSLVVTSGTVVAAYSVGVLVTLMAAYVPARRAARIPPVAALRTDISQPAKSLRRRLLVGLLVAAAGFVVVGSALSRHDPSAQTVALGCLLVFAGVVVLGPSISTRVVGVIGAPLRRLYGTTGRIAVENAQRNPRRTASTATALMIGIALVSGIGVLASSTTASTDAVIDKEIKADFAVANEAREPFAPQVAKDIAAIPGVVVVSRIQAVPMLIDGKVTVARAVDPTTITQVLTITMSSGSLADLGAGGMVIDDSQATSDHLSVGSSVKATLTTGEHTLTVVGVYVPQPGLRGPLVSSDLVATPGAELQDRAVYVKIAPDADPAKVRAAIDTALVAYPTVVVADQTQFKAQIRDRVNQLLAIVFLLLALAVFIAILGIVNTLALSVVERTREIGLLRALGTTRRQLRRMIRLESITLSVFGALMGLVLGVAFGAALQRSLVKDGITEFAVPWTLLLVVLVTSGLVGVLAALWPAARAARLDVLQAIASD